MSAENIFRLSASMRQKSGRRCILYEVKCRNPAERYSQTLEERRGLGQYGLLFNLAGTIMNYPANECTHPTTNRHNTYELKSRISFTRYITNHLVSKSTVTSRSNASLSIIGALFLRFCLLKNTAHVLHLSLSCHYWWSSVAEKLFSVIMMLG